MAETSEVAEWSMGEILDALGWKFARTGSKAQQFDVLGVTVDLQYLYAGKVEPGEAASPHGQLNFAQGQHLGAPLKPAMKFLSDVAAAGWCESMKPLLVVAAIYTKAVMQYDAPRCMSLQDETSPLVVFTDGAWEIIPDPSWSWYCGGGSCFWC
ncbi:unnamed protein product, partial [Cladocopium goreaui]